MSEPDATDVIVIGGGVVGCAVAQAFAQKKLGVFLLESEKKLALRTSSRNSGVVHSGLYYPPASLKARLCVAGNPKVYAWCARAHVGFRKTGKLVLARTSEEIPHLEQLYANARASGAIGITLVDSKALTRIEPQAQGVAALFCEETGIVDAVAFSRSLAAAAVADGAQVITEACVLGVELRKNAYIVQTTRGPIGASRVVNAAGFDAPQVASWFGASHAKHHACRGDYFRFIAKSKYQTLLYPVKVPGDPGLGIHLTIDLDGSARLGPDARYVADENDLAPAEDLRAKFAKAAQRLLGPIHEEDLVYDGCGIRPKLAGPGEADRDFVVAEGPHGVVHLLGIESPGLTASMSLADEVVRMLS